MRLLDSSSLKLREFIGRDIPKYVILSHTWGRGEITFQDLRDIEIAKNKEAFRKLEGCCKKAKSDGFQWVWIDTCCIDKSSSAELSEAINSMYEFYKNSQICYAYLEDVGQELDGAHMDEDLPAPASIKFRSFEDSRWWSRGWTLQELIAPSIVEFYTGDWTEIGTKLSLLDSISKVTDIEQAVLENSRPLDTYNIACRMSWASKRETTREEDKAYCLMGIFGVNMPLLYGEGRRAFHRLQEEIMKTHEDYTLFAWNYQLDYPYRGMQSYSCHADGIFASSPADFQNILPQWRYSELYASIPGTKLPAILRCLPYQVEDYVQRHWDIDPPILTSRGLSITLPMRRISKFEHLACLTTTRSPTQSKLLCLVLFSNYKSEGGQTVRRIYQRGHPRREPLRFISESTCADNFFEYRTIYLASRSFPDDIGGDFLSSALLPRDLPPDLLVVYTDDNLPIRDAFTSYQTHDALPDSRPKDEFVLGWLPYDHKPQIHALFKIGSADGLSTFIVGMGIGPNGKNVPWCDVLLHPNSYTKKGNTSDELIKAAIREQIVQNLSDPTFALYAAALDSKSGAIEKMFLFPLSHSFRSFGCFATSTETDSKYGEKILKLFDKRADRVIRHRHNATIRVAVRRSFAEDRNRYTLNISVQIHEPSFDPSAKPLNNSVESDCSRSKLN